MQLLLGCFGSVPPKALGGSFDVGHFMSDFILDVGHVICCCSAVSAADRQRLWKLIQLLIHSVEKQRFGTFARFRRPLAVRGSAPGKLLDLAACKILVNKLPAKRTVFIGSKNDMKVFVGLHFAWHGLESCCCSGVSHGLLHGILLGMNPAAVRAFRMGSSTAFCLAWARILLLFGRFAWAPSRHHGTSADGLAWALLSAPPRHLALRYTGFGPSLAARVLATRNVHAFCLACPASVRVFRNRTNSGVSEPYQSIVFYCFLWVPKVT